MKISRTKNGIRNIIWGVSYNLLIIIIPFFLRTIIIKSLGADYLGLSSLFTSILMVLSLADLGFSGAVVFCMYKPIAEDDKDTICALMNYLKKVYHIIGVIILGIGLIIMPFLRYIIKGDIPSDINLYILYLLFLANSSVSYFLFAHRNVILTAYQREDIFNKINILVKFITYALQIFSLIVLHNYYVYVTSNIISTILSNIIAAYYSHKIFPQYTPNGYLTVETKKVLTKNIIALFIGKIAMISRNAFDNIFISAFLGLELVTIYGNYYYIMNSINSILSIFLSSLSAGIGNSVASETREKNYNDMKKLNFIYEWIAGWCTVCLLCLYQPFMQIWMGNSMMLSNLDMILMCLYFYVLSIGCVRSQFSSAAGLYWEGRYYVTVEAVLNIMLNGILGYLFGVKGIIGSTVISIILVNFIWGTHVLFKYYFEEYNIKGFFKQHILYFVITCCVGFISYFLCNKLVLTNKFIELMFRAFICLIVPNVLFVLFYRKNTLFIDAKKMIVYSIKHMLKK